MRNRRFVKPRGEEQEQEQEEEEEKEENKEISGVRKVQREQTQVVLTQEPARGPALRKARGAGKLDQEGRPALERAGAGLPDQEAGTSTRRKTYLQALTGAETQTGHHMVTLSKKQ